MNGILSLVAVAGLFISAGLAQSTKSEILARVQGVSDESRLISALGEPDQVLARGSFQQWSYNASDGKVVFLVQR